MGAVRREGSACCRVAVVVEQVQRVLVWLWRVEQGIGQQRDNLVQRGGRARTFGLSGDDEVFHFPRAKSRRKRAQIIARHALACINNADHLR